MANLSLILFIALMGPLGMMLFVFKGDSRTVLLFLMVGIVACLFAGTVNGLILNCLCKDAYYLTLNVTPLVEEIVKGVPVLFFAFSFRPKRQLLLECAVAVGVGFALMENTYILGSGTDISLLLAVVRGFGAGMMHGICTYCVGYGISFIRTKRKLFYTGTVTLLSVAIVYHAIYNTLIQSRYSFAGLLLPVASLIPVALSARRKRHGK